MNLTKSYPTLAEWEKNEYTLEDILFAMNKIDDHYGVVAFDYREPKWVEFEKSGLGFSPNCLIDKRMLKKGYLLESKKEIGISWELGKTLSRQSQKTKNFLYNFLTKKGLTKT